MVPKTKKAAKRTAAILLDNTVSTINIQGALYNHCGLYIIFEHSSSRMKTCRSQSGIIAHNSVYKAM